MERRTFIEDGFRFFLAGAVIALVGCGKAGSQPQGMGNQEKLWKVVAGIEKTEQPVELNYAKDTPAFFRDASMGKADPTFAPKTGGG